MGKIKEKYIELAEIVEEFLNKGAKLEDIDRLMKGVCVLDDYSIYKNNKEFIFYILRDVINKDNSIQSYGEWIKRNV